MSDEGGIGERGVQAITWIVGVAMIGIGLLGMGTGTGSLWLVLGIFVTPQTRNEVFELCTIWVDSRDGD